LGVIYLRSIIQRPVEKKQKDLKPTTPQPGVFHPGRRFSLKILRQQCKLLADERGHLWIRGSRLWRTYEADEQRAVETTVRQMCQTKDLIWKPYKQ